MSYSEILIFFALVPLCVVVALYVAAGIMAFCGFVIDRLTATPKEQP